MANVKGTDMLHLRKMIHRLGENAENNFIHSLPTDLSDLYKNLMPINAGPVEKVTSIYELAAKVIFPNSSKPMDNLGCALAEQAYGGIYKILLKIPTRQAIIANAAKLWKTFFDQGVASVENIKEKSDEVVVRDFPSLPKKMREVVTGNFLKLILLTGRKNVQINLQDDDPNCWRWKISWE